MEGLQSQNSGKLGAEELAHPVSKVLPRQCSSPEISSSSNGKHLGASSLPGRSAGTPQQLPASPSESEKPRPPSRKRVLPAWMLHGDLVVPSASPSVPGRGRKEERKTGPGKKQKTTSSEDAALSSQDIQTVATEPAVPKVEKSKGRVLPQTPKISTVQNECLESRPPEPQPLERDISNKEELKEDGATSETENQRMSSQSPVPQDESEGFIPNQLTETRVSDFTGSSDVPQSSKVIQNQRIPCQYGRNCYRKNPIHFRQFSHPGDDDYQEPEAATSADDDGRPECPYGAACYRKNPQHKIEYKHTAPPVPLETERRQTRPRPVKKGRSVLDDDSDNDGEPNEYNLDDSFIDDEEEEECDPTDEDSDWEPDFEDKDNEDVDTLMKEAQQFVQTKK